ncbi:ATPase-like protein, partial [Linderina pennispora]
TTSKEMATFVSIAAYMRATNANIPAAQLLQLRYQIRHMGLQFSLIAGSLVEFRHVRASNTILECSLRAEHGNTVDNVSMESMDTAMSEKLPAVSLNMCDFTWGGGVSILQGVSLDILPRHLAIVTGPIGVGKSTLLQAIGGEVHMCAGHGQTIGKVVYVSQRPWMMGDTIRNNILFGLDYDQVWYQRVIKACALEWDFSTMADGDMTM